MATYRVIGKLAYRGHKTGEKFSADLDPEAERRAIQANAIELIDAIPTSLDPASVKAPLDPPGPKKEVLQISPRVPNPPEDN